MASKSMGYCRGGKDKLMILSEVALGKMYEKFESEYVEKLPEGFHSTKGLGRNGPDFSNLITLPNSVQIPVGNVINYEFSDEDKKKVCLGHNEYIVYDTSQVRMRYLIHFSDENGRDY